MPDHPYLTEFRIEPGGGGVIHLVFDAPDRSMNVFSNRAIHELGAFARWLKTADVTGVVVRSGKPAFCAGADLAELGVAYDMIMAAPKAERTRVAYDHFFPLSQALRALETSGKPVAAALGGLALGGGCELAMGCHYRVMVDDPKVVLGLPESLVGLLPGGGGTQRLPRLVGIGGSLPILLDGKRLSATEALAAGLVHEVVVASEEVAAAERWVRANPDARQPWDRPDWRDPAADVVGAVIVPARTRVLIDTKGHYPAPLAILDCIEDGVPVPMDEAIATEMSIFAALIQRPEPRNMIQTLFLGKLDHDRRVKAGTLPAALADIETAVAGALAGVVGAAKREGRSPDDIARAYSAAGFSRPLSALPDVGSAPHVVDQATGEHESAGLWFELEPTSGSEALGRQFLLAAAAAARPAQAVLADGDRRVVDYALVGRLGFPSYLGGPFALLDYLGLA
jgi:3-hydroxyacyl-CoA dehydrogenase/enoyl-CoA hydratase/3-hydroxybutyryl-CoA epimerase